MITIDITLDDSILTSFYGLHIDPFSIGEIVNLDVESLSPRDLSVYDEGKAKQFLDKNDEEIKKLKLKKIKLIERNSYVRIKMFKENDINIEYTCEFID